MADYKLVDSNKLDTDLASVANAIRKRAGTSEKLEFPEGFENAVKNIPGGGEELPTLTNPGSASDLVKDKELIDQNGNILTGTMESMATTTITPGTTAQTITQKYINGTLTIKGDNNLKAENIKEGVKIFDVLGALSASSGGTVEIGEWIEVESLSEAHYWTKTGMAGGTINETYDDRGATIGFTNESVQYADEIALEGNSLVLVNPKSYTITTDDDAAEDILVGKYFSGASGFYRIPSDAVIIYYAPTQYTKGHLTANKVYKLSVTPGTEEQFSIIVSGNRNAYPDNGEQDGFTYVYQGVVSATYPELTNPASAADLVLNKQLIDADGNVVTGTLAQWSNGTGYSGTASFKGGSLYIDSPDMTERKWIEKGEHIYLRTDAANLGDATPADVAKGKTFTSASGLLEVGEMEVNTFAVTDDGKGNVTITSSAITDNNGNVTIT